MRVTRYWPRATSAGPAGADAPASSDWLARRAAPVSTASASPSTTAFQLRILTLTVPSPGHGARLAMIGPGEAGVCWKAASAMPAVRPPKTADFTSRSAAPRAGRPRARARCRLLKSLEPDAILGEVRLIHDPTDGSSGMSSRRAMLALTSAAVLISLTGGCTAFYWS